jgi:H+/Cl- antiporter ClcA
MGGSLADTFGRLVQLSGDDRRLLVMSGIAGGFGSVFGTPIAGAIFGVEVVRAGSVRHAGLFPSLVAGLVGKAVTDWWGVGHAHYLMGVIPGPSALLLVKVAIAGLAFGAIAALFTESIHRLRSLSARLIPTQAFRPAVGGLLVIFLTVVFQSRAYLGLSLPLVHTAFAGTVDPFAFLWKTLFTVVTLGSGFQGGEVTPLFIIGATLGSTLSHLLALPPGFLTGLGFVAVFAGAANTPLACIVMGVELFGHGALPYSAVACVIAYVISGQRSIYSSQDLIAKGS